MRILNDLTHFLIKNGSLTPCTSEDFYDWSEENRDEVQLRQEYVGVNKEIWVSTIFLGMDQNIFYFGDPILWETRIFSDLHQVICKYIKRYSTRLCAVKGHDRAINVANRYLRMKNGTFRISY